MEASKLKDRLEQEWPGNDWDGDQSAVLSVEGSDDTKLSCFHAPDLQFFTLLFVHEEIMRLYLISTGTSLQKGVHFRMFHPDIMNP